MRKRLSERVGFFTFAVILGPSGSGKSTLLKAISGLEVVNSGSVNMTVRNFANSAFGADSVSPLAE